MKLFGNVQRINWGETILIRDLDKFECHVNPYGDSVSGIPSEHHTEIAKIIVKAVNNYDEVLQCLNDILDELDGAVVQTSMNCHIEHATKLVNQIKSDL